MIAIYAWRDWASSFSDGLSSIPLEASRESFRRARNGQTECPLHPRPDLRFSAFNGLVCPRHGLSAGGKRIRTRGPSSQGRRHLFADEKGRRSIAMAVNGSVYFVGDLRFGSRLGRRRVPFRRELRFHTGLTPLR